METKEEFVSKILCHTYGIRFTRRNNAVSSKGEPRMGNYLGMGDLMVYHRRCPWKLMKIMK
jgi:hypothetical protein